MATKNSIGGPKPTWDAQLNRDDLASDDFPTEPLALFEQWFKAARVSDIIEPTGATLATANSEGSPSARTVLVKSFDESGFYFYTNYASRKGKELSQNPQAALLFWWDQLERQVRIEGDIVQVTSAQSDRYFSSRPRGSQIGAHASPQSQPIISRTDLEQAVVETQAKYTHAEVPRPQNWGGYCLKPKHMEFWQGRTSRLHDRLAYSLKNNAWQIERLAP